MRQTQIAAPENFDLEELAIELRVDPMYASMLSQQGQEDKLLTGYQVKGRLLFKDERLVIPQGSPLTLRLIKHFHASKEGGHEGALNTFKWLTKEVYWKGLRKDVVEYITKCQMCQTCKYSTLSLVGLLSPLPIPR